MPLGEIHHQGHFGFRNLVGKHADHSDSLFMHGQHDVKGLRMGQPKEPFQHMHDKLHRRVIVV